MKLMVIFAFILFASANELNSNVEIKRSGICLIERVAAFNKISATFDMTNHTNINGVEHFIYKLELGAELYNSSGTSKQKSKEKVAREAYALTKYQKPNLRNRTCAVDSPLVKSNLSILHEYAQYLNQTMDIDEKHISQKPNVYEITLRLNGKKISVTSHSKKDAKNEAAGKLFALLGGDGLVRTLIMRFNEPRYHDMSPMQRLQKIVKANDLSADVQYTIQQELDRNENGQTVHEVRLEGVYKNYIGTGIANNVATAKNMAAEEILKSMGFTSKFFNTKH